MGRDTIGFEDTVSTISKEYLLEFTSEYGIPESLHPELPSPEEPIVEFPDDKVSVYTKFFEFANYHERIFLTVVEWCINPPKDKISSADSYSEADVTTLNTHRTPIQKQPKALLCLVGLSRSYFLGDDVYLTFLHDDDRDMNLFNLISAPNPTKVALEPSLEKKVATMGPRVNKRRRKRGNDKAKANASPKVLRMDHAALRPAQRRSYCCEKRERSRSAVLCETTTAPRARHCPVNLLGKRPPRSPPKMLLPRGARLVLRGDSRVREINLLPLDGQVARRYLSVGVAMGSQLRLRFEQEVRLLKKPTAKIAKRDQRIQAREEDIKKLDQEIKSLRAVEAKVYGFSNQTKNLETLLEAEVDMKKAAEAKNAELVKELESLRVHDRGSSLGHRARLALGRYEVYRVLELRQAFVDVVSTRLVKGMSKGLKHDIEHRKDDRYLEVVKAYDLKADNKYVKALQDLKDLKYPLILIYPEVCDPEDPWACKEEMLLEDAITANKSQAEKKKKCRVVCRTHRIGFAHHARSDGILVSVPTIAPWGLAILLADVATQTEVANKEDEPHPRLQRSISL
nr:hypothetical protein [Tanacetum cinerariifolium]GEW22655.1 hypothetical protein [Tanacetum cinerariifolium]GEW22660.1 hypothetical protein [Tanacetum cinerariifolium]